MTSGAHYVERLAVPPGAALRLAVKDLVDVEGVPTTAGCRAVAATAAPAPADAQCLAGFRRAGAAVTGKTNLHELAFGVTGENPWYGTPENPLDPSRMPGGSSSGSAVAVAIGDADVAIGTDTGGSIRIPAACCGVAGLKTTVGRFPTGGVRPLAQSFDTVGPMARDVRGLVTGLRLLLDADELVLPDADVRVGRLSGLADVDAAVDGAIDRVLGASGAPLEAVALPGWADAFAAHRVILAAEAFACDGHLLAGAHAEGVAAETRTKLERGSAVTPAQLGAARATSRAWREELATVLERVHVLALPAIPCPPPLLGADWSRLVWLTAPVNLALLPAVVIPIPQRRGLPASLQLVGAPGSEELLLAVAARMEAAAAA